MFTIKTSINKETYNRKGRIEIEQVAYNACSNPYCYVVNSFRFFLILTTEQIYRFKFTKLKVL